jgi:hypothetical protein
MTQLTDALTKAQDDLKKLADNSAKLHKAQSTADAWRLVAKIAKLQAQLEGNDERG